MSRLKQFMAGQLVHSLAHEHFNKAFSAQDMNVIFPN